MSLTEKKINLLIIGNKEWYDNFLPILTKLDENYTVEYISDIRQANARLWHNSYDILLLEESFSKQHTIELSKMSYAMSRPSIIICNNKFRLLLYFIWKHFGDFTSRFITSKKLIYFMNEKDKHLISFIKSLANHHHFFSIISQEIKKNTSI